MEYIQNTGLLSQEDVNINTNKTQKSNKFDKLLPYYKTTFSYEINLQINDLIDNLCKSIQFNKYRPDAYHWSMQLYLYILRHGLTFDKSTHLKLVDLLYEVITNCDIDHDILDIMIVLLDELLRKKECLSRKDLMINFQPLLKLYKWSIIDAESDNKANYGLLHLPKHFPSHIGNLIRSTRVYYAPNTWRMLNQSLGIGYLMPFDGVKMEQYMYLLELFTPTNFCDQKEFYEEIEETFEGDGSVIEGGGLLKRLCDLYMSCDIITSWDTHLVTLFARVAHNNVGRYNWPASFVDFFFAKFMANLSLPLSGVNISIQAVKKGLTGSTSKLPVFECAKWMVYTLKGRGTATPQSLNDQPTLKNFTRDPVADRICRLMAAIENYLHPSNSGKWTGTLVKLINSLVSNMAERIYLERHKKYSWESPIPDEAKISDSQLKSFVAILKPAIFLIMFDKQFYRSIPTTIKTLVSMDPGAMMPTLLEKILSSFEVVLEPHRLRSCLTVASVLTLPLTTNAYDYEGHEFLVDSFNCTTRYNTLLELLNYALIGIDPNDSFKCASSLLLISALVSLIPMPAAASSTAAADADLVVTENAADWSDNQLIGGEVLLPTEEVSKVTASSDFDQIKKSRQLEFEILQDSGRIFQDFVLKLLDKCFGLANSMDNSTLDFGGFVTTTSNLRNMREELKGGTGGQGAQKSRDESSISFSIMSVVETVLRQCPPSIYENAVRYALDRLKGILYSSKPARDAISDLCLGVCIANPRLSIPIFAPYLMTRLSQCLDELPQPTPLLSSAHETNGIVIDPQFPPVSAVHRGDHDRDEPECMWYAQILASITKRTGTAPLLALEPQIMQLLHKGIKADSLCTDFSVIGGTQYSHHHPPFLTTKNDVFEMLVEFLSNVLNCLSKVYVCNYSSLNPNDWKSYLRTTGAATPSIKDTTNSPSLAGSPFEYWGKMYLQKEVRIEWHKPSTAGLRFCQTLLQTFLKPCMNFLNSTATAAISLPPVTLNTSSPSAKVEPPGKGNNSTRATTHLQLRDEKEMIRRCLCMVEKCLIGCGPVCSGLNSSPCAEYFAGGHYDTGCSTFSKHESRAILTVATTACSEKGSKCSPSPPTEGDIWWSHHLRSLHERFIGITYPVLTTVALSAPHKKEGEHFSAPQTINKNGADHVRNMCKVLDAFGFRTLRAEICSLVHRFLWNRLLTSEEDYVSQGYVINIYRRILFYRGYEQKDLESKFQVYKFMKSYFGDKIRFPKRLPRFAYAVRAQIQHEIYCNKHIDNQFLSKCGPSWHLLITSDLVKLALTASYSGVREKCLGLLDDIMWRWKNVSHTYVINWLYASIPFNFGPTATAMFKLLPPYATSVSGQEGVALGVNKTDRQRIVLDETLQNLHLHSSIDHTNSNSKPMNLEYPAENRGNAEEISLARMDEDADITSWVVENSHGCSLKEVMELGKQTQEDIDRICETAFAIIEGKGGISNTSSSKGNHVEGSNNCLGATNYADDNYKVWRLMFEIPLPEKNQIIEIFDDCLDAVFEEGLINLKRYYYVSEKTKVLLKAFKPDLEQVTVPSASRSCKLESVPSELLRRDGTEQYPNYVTLKPLTGATKATSITGSEYGPGSSSYIRIPVNALPHFDRIRDYLVHEALPVKGLINWRYRFMAFHALADCVIYRETQLDPSLTYLFFNGLAATVSDDSPLIRELFLSNCCTLLKILKYDFSYPKANIYIIPPNKEKQDFPPPQHQLSSKSKPERNLYLHGIQLANAMTYDPEVSNRSIYVHKVHTGYVNFRNPMLVIHDQSHISNPLSTTPSQQIIPRGNLNLFFHWTFEPLIQTLDNKVLDEYFINHANKDFAITDDSTKGTFDSINRVREQRAFPKPYYESIHLINVPSHVSTHEVIYNICSSPDIVEITLTKLLESEDTDVEFDMLRVNFFKGLFRNNGPSLTAVYLDYVKCKLFQDPSLAEDKESLVGESNLDDELSSTPQHNSTSIPLAQHHSDISTKRLKNKCNKPVTSVTAKKRMKVKASTQLSVHCIASEILCAWIRASKYWPSSHAKQFYELYKDFIENILKSLTPENIVYWRNAFDAACLNRDPNHLSWLIQHVVSLSLSFFSTVSSPTTNKLGLDETPISHTQTVTPTLEDNKSASFLHSMNKAKRKHEEEEGVWSTLAVSYTLEITFDVLKSFVWRIRTLHSKILTEVSTFFNLLLVQVQAPPTQKCQLDQVSLNLTTTQNNVASIPSSCYSEFIYNYRSKNFQTALSQILVLPLLYLNPFWNASASHNHINNNDIQDLGDYDEDELIFHSFVHDLLLPSLLLYLKFPPKESANAATIKGSPNLTTGTISTAANNNSLTLGTGQSSQCCDTLISNLLQDSAEFPYNTFHHLTNNSNKMLSILFDDPKTGSQSLDLSVADSERVENHVKIFVKTLLFYFIATLHPFHPEVIALLPALFYLEKRVQYTDAHWSAEMYTSWTMMSRTLLSTQPILPLPPICTANHVISTRHSSGNINNNNSSKLFLLHVLAKEFATTPFWKSRSTVVLFLRNSVFSDFLFDSGCDDCKRYIWRFCLAGLVDPIVEVRENSRDTLSGLLRCKYLPFIGPEIEDKGVRVPIKIAQNSINSTSSFSVSLLGTLSQLLEYDNSNQNKGAASSSIAASPSNFGFYGINDNHRFDPQSLLGELINLNFSNTKTSNPIEMMQPLIEEQMKTDSSSSPNYNYYSGGILGLCAIVEAFPYDIPKELPAVLIKLSQLSQRVTTRRRNVNDPAKDFSGVKVTDTQLIRKTMANFKRTHLDNWQDHKSKFTDEELEVLADLLVSPNYYA